MYNRGLVSVPLAHLKGAHLSTSSLEQYILFANMRAFTLLALATLPFLAVDTAAHTFKVDSVHRPTFCAFFHYSCQQYAAEDLSPLLKNVCKPSPTKPGYYIATCLENGGGQDITNLCLSTSFPTKPSPAKNQALTATLQPDYCNFFTQACDQICAGYPKNKRKESCSTAKHNGNWVGTSECYCGNVDFSGWISSDIIINA